MNIFLLGVNHHQTPVEIREKLAAINAGDSGIYRHYASSEALRESILISTCNRLEVLGVAGSPTVASQELIHFLAAVAHLAPEALAPHLVHYDGLDAVRHIFRVASSLDSMVLGEPQVLGQLKDAFRQALKNRTAGPITSKIMHKSFRAAKRVRTETLLAGGAVSVASAAVALARSIKGPLKNLRVAVLGAGPMAELAMEHLRKKGVRQLAVAGRTLERAAALAEKHGAEARGWEALPELLAASDLVIAATGAAEPVLTESNTRGLFRDGALIIDIGVPRNVAPEVGRDGRATVKNIDDLEAVVKRNRDARKAEADKAEEIIAAELDKFSQWLNSLSTWPTVVALTRKAEEARKLEMRRTMSQHQFSPNQKAALEIMTRSLVRRILHDPLNFLKTHGPGYDHGQDSSHKLEAVRRAFNLDDT